MPFDVMTMPNGLRVVGERIPHFRSVSVGLWIGTGSQNETPGEAGVSHFLEHMVFKGTQRRSARQIAEEMDAVGGQLNAFTGKDCTCLYAKVIDENLDLAVDILSDLALHATLDEADFNKERGVILEEIAMDEDSPEDLVHELLSQAQFGTQALAMPILGTEEKISAYQRDDLAAFRRKHYRPADTVVALDGEIYGKPVDYADAFRMISAFSGKTHEVYTAFAIVKGEKNYAEAVATAVTFRALSDQEIDYYIKKEAPYDKAGAYGIQELAGIFVEKIEGNFDNVVGLPLCQLETAMKREFGISLFSFAKT